MSEERKPVLCPWCKLRGVDSLMEPVACYGADVASGYYWCRKCDSQSSRARNTKAAYLAATRRPENRPLTLEQIRQLEYCDAVFSADEYGHITVWSGEEVKLYVSKCINWQFKQFFARKPTPEDIEAARSEKGEQV